MASNILLRFNTKALENDPLVWRVFIDGEEHLASSFKLIGEMGPVITYESGVKKYNVGCIGKVVWVGTEAVVISID